VAAYEYRRIDAVTVSTLIATYPSSAKVAGIDSVINGLSPSVLQSDALVNVGWPTIGTGGSSTDYLFFHNLPAPIAGYVDTLNLLTSNSGALLLKALSDNGDGTVTVLSSNTVNIPSTGVSSLSIAAGTLPKIQIPIGGYLAVTSLTGGARIMTDTANGATYYSVAGVITGTVAKGTANSAKLAYNYDIKVDAATTIPANVITGLGLIGGSPVTNILGPVGLTTNTSAMGNATGIIDQPAMVSGFIKKINASFSGAGTVVIHTVTKNTDGTFNVINSATLPVIAGSQSIHVPNLAIAKGAYIALYSTVNIAMVSGSSAAPYYFKVGDISGSNVVMGGRETTYAYAVAFEYENTPTITVQSENIDPVLLSRVTASESVIAGLAFEGGLPLLGTIGPGALTTNTVAMGNATGIHDQQVVADGFITKLSATFSAAGTVVIHAVTRNTDGTFNVINSFTSSVVIGYNEVQVPNLAIAKGSYIALYSTATIAMVSGSSAAPYYFKVGDISGSNVVMGGREITYAYAVTFDYTYTPPTTILSEHIDPVLISRITSLEAEVTTLPGNINLSTNALLESVSKFTSLPAGWNNAGAWTFVEGAAGSTGVGIDNQLRTNKRYGLDKRVIRWEFEITSATTTVAFLTNPIEGAIAAGSVIQITSAGALNVMTKYSGQGTPTILSAHSMGFTLSIGVRYVFEWELAGRTFTTRIWNPQNAANQSFEYSRTVSAWGYTTYPSWVYDQGTMQGAPGVAVIVGSANMCAFDHYASGSPAPYLYVIGDSITEHFGIPDKFTLATLLRKEFGTHRVMNSGVGGAQTPGALLRIQDELIYIRPQWVLIYVVNNDDSYATNLSSIIAFAQALGCKVIVGTIPGDTGRSNIIKALPESVYKVDWAAELTDNGAGITKVAAYYASTDASGAAYNDNLHPNALGDLRRFKRLRADVPTLFS